MVDLNCRYDPYAKRPAEIRRIPSLEKIGDFRQASEPNILDRVKGLIKQRELASARNAPPSVPRYTLHNNNNSTPRRPLSPHIQRSVSEPLPDLQRAAVPPALLREEEINELTLALATLHAQMNQVFRGENSLSRQIESLDRRRQSLTPTLDSLQETQMRIRERLESLEQRARESMRAWEENSERLESHKDIAHKWAGTDPDQTGEENHEINEIMSAGTNWAETNSKLMHLKKCVHTPTQIAAFEFLDFVHKRLTSHLLAYISECYKTLPPDKKQAYLNAFRNLNMDSDNSRAVQDLGIDHNIAVYEGTYAELLEVVQQSVRSPKKPLEALKASESRLVEEAHGRGYDTSHIGDIRYQMSGFHHRIEKNFMECKAMNHNEFCSDIVAETRRAAEEGKLGILQKASRLIRLGCFFLQANETVS
eukprot:Gb_25489 [translate_table: standard]